MQLYEYQLTAVSAALRALSSTAKALINLATGLGKTIVMREVSKPFTGRILFLCHDTDILEQNMERFADLYNKVGEVGLYHGDDKSGVNARFVFATFQTMVIDKERFGADAFCLVMVDECHHTPAPTFRAVTDFFNCPKLGASATIERMDGLKVEAIFGEPVISIDLPEAIAKGYLTPFEYRIMSDGLNQEVLQRLLGEAAESRKLTVDDVNKKLFIQKRDEEIVRTVQEEAGDKKTLVFCRNIDHANRISRLLGKGSVTTHSGLKRETNRQRLQAFRQGRVQYLVVVNKANEGVDIPDAEVVVFLRATESKTIFLQQLGRTLRKAEGKVRSLVLDFAGSLQRLSMVKDLAWSIRDEYENGNGKGSLHEAMTVSGAGFDFIFNTEVVQALELFERVQRPNFYSYTEAKARVQELEIANSEEYARRYKEDPRLPAAPRGVYSIEWQGWSAFLGRRDQGFYSYTEAKAAVKRMEITSYKAYRRDRSKDPRLPGKPSEKYRKDWKGWLDFLGKQGKGEFCSYTEAVNIVSELGIKSHLEYVARYKEDSRLPSNPNKKYVDEWIGWREFLGISIPYTYEEARKVATGKSIVNSNDYGRRYKEDPRLPAVPARKYKAEWVSWQVFLGRE